MNSHIKDNRLGQVKDVFVLGRIQSLQDIYKIIPRTTLAHESKISVTRFKGPRKLTVADVRMLAEMLDLPAMPFFDIISKDITVEKVKPVEGLELKLSILNDRLYLGHLQYLHEVFEIVPRTLVARSLGTNNNAMGKFVIAPETGNMRLIMRVAAVLRIDSKVLFNLIENELRDKEGKKILRLKSQRKKAGAPK